MTAEQTSGQPPGHWHHGDVDPDLTRAALACARSVFGDAGLVSWTPLTGSTRSAVARMVLLTDAGSRTVIVKSTDGNARERAALEVLTKAEVAGVPRLLAVSEDPPVLLLEDAGTGASVADRLLGDDRSAAASAVEAWAVSVARIQAATLSRGAAFRDRLIALAPDAEPEMTSAAFDGTVSGFAQLLPEIGATFDDQATAEFYAIQDRLRVDPGAQAGPGALTPGDTCPDNNVGTPDGLVLIDFEGADFRHVAWEAAYLSVPWPTCWCSWRMPAAVTAAAIERWRETLAPALDPEVAAGLDDAVRDATTCWSLFTAARLLPLALGHASATQQPDRSPPAPLQLLQHRLSVAAASADDGPLQRFATATLAATRREWGDQPLPLGPVWR